MTEKFTRDELDPQRPAGRGAGSAARDLRAALSQALIPTDGRAINVNARNALRTNVRTFAMTCRARHSSPEATLIALKRVIADVDRSVIDVRPIVDHDAEHELIEQVIAWCIEDYYRDD